MLNAPKHKRYNLMSEKGEKKRRNQNKNRGKKKNHISKLQTRQFIEIIQIDAQMDKEI